VPDRGPAPPTRLDRARAPQGRRRPGGRLLRRAPQGFGFAAPET
jgi:hypothetical protein